MDHNLEIRAAALRIALGATAALAGLDKFFNILADWTSYVSPLAVQLLPISPDAFMHVVGIVELGVGIAILAAAPVLGAYVASAWLLLVAGNLVLGGHFDIAVRDVVMAVAAFTLARLLELRGYALAPAGVTGRVPVATASTR
jgi:hypothetical protein